MTSDYDATVRHAIYVERHKAKVARKILDLVRGVSNELYNAITASDLDTLTRRQLDRLLRDVEGMIRIGYGPIEEAVTEAVRDFAVYEAQWQGDVFNKAGILADIAIPSDADIWAAVNARPFEGKFLKDWIAGLSANTVDRVAGAIRQGYVDGRGPLDIAREIRGTRTRRGVMDISARGAEMMVRTAMASTSSVAKERTLQASPGVKEVQWVSVLDHRTTPICRARDGEIYPKGEGPRPPAHVGCRSTVVPVTRGNREQLESRETYQQWLARQKPDVQDDILGPSRGKLFRDGGYKVDRFVDESGEEYTLDQLRVKDAATFEEVFGASVQESIGDTLRRAGLDDGNEHFILTQDGREVMRGTSGDARKITFTSEQVKAMSDPSNPVVLNHNHPANAVSFSPADMSVFARLRGVEEITAFAYEADFFASRTGKTARMSNRVIQGAEREAQIVLGRAFNSGGDIGQLLELQAHAMSLILEKRGYIKYRHALPARLDRAAKLISEAL